MFCCVEFELWKYPHCGDISESISSYADAAIERSLNISPILVKDGKSLETLSNEKKQDIHFCTNVFFFVFFLKERSMTGDDPQHKTQVQWENNLEYKCIYL